MIIDLEINDKKYQADLAQPLDISIPLGQVKCFYAPDVMMEPYTDGDFIGSVNRGAPVNFYNVQLNPHGNGTHTECLGHITKAQESVNKILTNYHFAAYLVTVPLDTLDNEDQVITLNQLNPQLPTKIPQAIIIRTSPNNIDKKTKDYSGTNPPYIAAEAMRFLVNQGVQHLLIDTPSVDREVDEGLLAAHHIFWGLDADGNTIDTTRTKATITELIYVDNDIVDGYYLLNLQIAPLELDASPSKPILYKLNSI